MSQIKGSKVLITGGASWIGKFLGKRLLEQGAQSLIIWDINEEALQATAKELDHYDVHTYCIDLRDRAAIHQITHEVISSAAGMLSNPMMSIYTGSKWALLGWSESLRLELRNTEIKVSTITPSYIDTGMFEGVQTNLLLPLLKTEKVVKAIIKAITHNKRYVRLPFLVKILPFIKGILPPFIFDVFVGKWLGIYNSMAPFKGRK